MSSAARPGVWRLTLGTAAFAVVAPIGLAALPLAMLLVATRPRPGYEWAVALGLAALGAWSLVPAPGDRRGTVVAVFALLVAVAFTGGTLLAPVGFLRQAVRAGLWAAAATAVLAWAVWGGLDWRELRWEATRSATVAVFTVVGFVPRLFQVVKPVVRVFGDAAPLWLALQTWAGLAVARGWHGRLAPAPAPAPLAAPAEVPDARLAPPRAGAVPNHT
jgi:hypothetical protein